MMAAVHARAFHGRASDPVADHFESGALETPAHSTNGPRCLPRCRPSPRFVVESDLAGVVPAPPRSADSVLAGIAGAALRSKSVSLSLLVRAFLFVPTAYARRFAIAEYRAPSLHSDWKPGGSGR